MFEHKLKILHLEDLPEDAELIERALRKAGLQFDLLLAANKNDFLAGLSRFEADIILSDHSLPDLDSREALRLTKLQSAAVPFILVTATVSEEYAVEIMKEGAYDYVLKDRLQRLPKAIENAIEKWRIEKERQKYLEATVASEARYRQIVETAQEGIWLVDHEFRTTFVNQKMCEILEYSAAEMMGRENTYFMNNDSKVVAANARGKWKSGIAERYDLCLVTKRGKYIWASLSVSAIVDDNKNFKGLLAMVTDITNKKVAEDKLQQERALLRTLIDNIPDSVFIKDVQGQYRINNRASVEFFGLGSEEKSLGKSVAELLPITEAEKLIRDDQHVLESGESLINKEESIVTSDGRKHWLLTSKIPLKDESGNITGLVGIRRDVTDQKEISERLAAKEKRFRALVENISDGIVVHDKESNLIYQSPSVTRILGYTESERNKIPLRNYVHPDFLNAYDELYKTIEKNPGQPMPFLFPYLHKNGNYVWLEGLVTNLTQEPSVSAYVANYRDVTQRRKTEEELQQKKYFLEKAQEIAKVGYWILNSYAGDASLIWSKETCGIFGVLENEFDQRWETFVQFVHRDDRDKVTALSLEAIAEALPYKIDYRIQLQNGTIRWVHDQAEVIFDEHGVPQKMIGIIQDVTERKIIEEVLRQFNERYELLSKATNDAIWDWDVTLGLVNWNHGLQTVFGYPESDVEYTFDWWEKRVHPEDRDEAVNSLTQATKGQQNTWSDNYRFRTANGGYKYVYDRAYILYNDEHQPVRMIGAMQDVSERMQAMEEIEKLSFVASKTDNAVMITDAEQNIEWVNEGFARMTGYTLEEVKGREANFLQGAETDMAVVNWMNIRLQQGESVTGELINYSKTGRKYWSKLNITPVFGDDGVLKNFISIQSDITQQKEFESKITSIARELSSLIENANVPIFGIDRNGYINEWNKVSEEITGFSKSELLGRRWVNELVSTDNRLAAEQIIAHVLHGKPVSNFELPMFTKSRKRLILLLSASPRRDSEKVINGAILVAQDITELIEYRRNLEKMVQDRTRELNEALQKEKELVSMKSRFVSIASHEFRTPLSTITLATGFLKKFKQKLKPADVDDKLINIEKQVSHMTHLLDDVLLIGKAEAGKIPVRLGKIEIFDFFERLCKEIEQSAGATHEVRFINYLQVPTMYSDEKLLRNIVINVLTNAIKFSPGASYVDVTLRSDADKFSFHVRDYGIGIPIEDMNQLFEPFHRGSNANTIQGTGLGLSIIKKAVDLFQGFIDVKSEVGKGTDVNIILPVLHE